MSKLSLTVKTVTPLLMYGAANKPPQQFPELRAPAIRGILRYWLRAVLGATKPKPADLYVAESAILGKTEQGSRIKVSVMPSRQMQRADTTVRVLPERLRFTGYEADSEFRITFTTHPLADETILRGEFLDAVRLMVHLGGLGRRARRGSGNLRVLKVAGIEETGLDYLPEDMQDLTRYLVATCAGSDEYKGIAPSSVTVGHRPDFATFAWDTACVLLAHETYVNYREAFDALWSASGPYHHQGGIFGDVRPRRASAIHMRVSESHSGYHPLMTIFYAGKGDWSKMKDFINHCQHQGFSPIYGDWSHW